MKNICFLTGCIIFNTLLSYGQMDVSAGVSLYNSQNFNMGLNAGASLNNFYLDISSNLKGGSGNRLSSGSNYPLDTKRDFIFLMNAGYNVQIKEKWFITPIIGIGWTWDIYQNISGYLKYYYRDPRSFFNIGLSTKFFLNDDVGIIVGGGLNELFKASIVYKLWD
ncbi:MAG: hypothetical protein NTY95_00080 [Bacteroidia bacterium]|nr:hypothetical protein [Bacteroidia bacterium]